MKVSAIQMNMKFSDSNLNFINAEKLIRQAAKDKPDTIVFPETWNTGFFPIENRMELADHNGERTKKLFSSLCKEFDINIVAGSIVCRKDSGLYNTSFVFNKKGKCIAEYDKTHLYTKMHEDYYFNKGNNIALFELDGIKCGVVICYDIRFTELIRTIALQEIKILFVVAQWPIQRINHWEILNLAHAIGNQIFVVGVNSPATAGEAIFGGNSLIINPMGEILAKADFNEMIITAELDMDVVNETRKLINVYNDRRTDLYKVN